MAEKTAAKTATKVNPAAGKAAKRAASHRGGAQARPAAGARWRTQESGKDPRPS